MSNHRPPGDHSHLERLITSQGKARGVAPDRIRRWVSTMVLLGALDRQRREGSEPMFLLKGGVAIELRLGLRARATKDIDMIFRGDPEQLRDALEDALVEPYNEFAFRIANERAVVNTPARRIDIKLTWRGRAWSTVQLEISPPESGAAEPEILEAIGIDDLGLDGPQSVAYQSLRYQIATKLHAVTERFADRDNDRYRDLIDLLLMRELISDWPATRAACIDIFSTRNTHAWPPTLTAEPSWRQPGAYARLAEQYSFAPTDADFACADVTSLIARIDAANPA